jgi:hypothetical protein
VILDVGDDISGPSFGGARGFEVIMHDIGSHYLEEPQECAGELGTERAQQVAVICAEL